MKKIIITCLIIFISFGLLNAQKSHESEYHENIVIFKLKEESRNKSVETEKFNNLLSSYQINQITKEFPNSISPKSKFNRYGQSMVDLSYIYRIELSVDNRVEDLINELNKLEMVEYAEPLYKIELLHIPDDPYAETGQYWLTTVKAYEAWDIHKGDTSIVIGISDTGIELSHPDLIYNIKYNYNDLPDGIDNDGDGYVDNFRGWNFGENNNNTQADVNNHGVVVSGIAGASTNNGIGVAGAGYLCKILPLKITNSAGTIVNAYQSIVYAAEHGCDVINCSWGSENFQRMGQDVINYATYNHDLLVIAACGNTNTETDYYPASYENVISVAATTQNDEKWTPENTPTGTGSSYGYNVDICAPGTMFYSTSGTSYSQIYGGTSFAAPIVSGCAGILRSYYPEYSALQIGELLKISTDNIYNIQANQPYVGKLGTGRINFLKALTIEPTPSVVFRDFSLNYFEDRLIINGEFTNFLATADNLSISLNLISDNSYLQNELIFSGSLNTLETHISENEIIILFTDQVYYGDKARLDITYTADGYSSKQVLEFLLKEEFENVETDILSLSVTAHGRLGFGDLNKTVGRGLVIDNVSNILSECGIISGISSSQIYSSVKQVSDFKTTVYPYKVNGENDFDFHVRYEFNDSNDYRTNGLKIIQDVYSKHGSENKNFIIVDYKLINLSNTDINSFYFGLYADWDLANPAYNSTGYITDQNFLYCKSDTRQTMYAGIKLLSGQSVNNYAVPLIAGGDGLIDLTNGFLDVEKFYMISNSNEGYPGDSTDIVIYTGTGPLDIISGDTVVVGFSIIAGNDYYNFERALNTSRQVYEELHNKTDIGNYYLNEIEIYPNPSKNYLKVGIQELNDIFSYEITNILGEKVLSSFYSGNEINIESLPAGFYQLRLNGKDKIYTAKFVKI